MGFEYRTITGGGLRRLEKICSRLSALKPSSRLMQALIGFFFFEKWDDGDVVLRSRFTEGVG